MLLCISLTTFSAENDNSPAFTTTPMAVSIAESSAVGSSVADMLATDADQGTDGNSNHLAQVANTATIYEQPMYEAYSVAIYTT